MSDAPQTSAPPDTAASPAPEAAEATPQAVREDQVQNAVVFLSHPKVRGSSEATKRSFLERKGLTAAEIGAAFQRVPDIPAPALPASTSAPQTGQPATLNNPAYGAGQLVTYQPQQAAAAPVAPGIVPHAAPQPHSLALPPPPEQQPIRWSQVVLGAGVIAAALYTVQHFAVPTVRAWFERGAVAREALAAEERARAEALRAALEAVAGGQAELQAAVVELSASLKGQQAAMEEQAAALQRVLQLQQQQAAAASGADGVEDGSGPTNGAAEAVAMARLESAIAQLREEVRRLHPPDSAASAPSHSSAHAAGAGAAGAPTRSATAATPFAHPGSAAPPLPPVGGEGRAATDEAPKPPGFEEVKLVFDMVRRGITPPNVRTDIDDAPPDPTRPFTAPSLKPKPKPWEVRGAATTATSLPSSGASDTLYQAASLGATPPAPQPPAPSAPPPLDAPAHAPLAPAVAAVAQSLAAAAAPPTEGAAASGGAARQAGPAPPRTAATQPAPSWLAPPHREAEAEPTTPGAPAPRYDLTALLARSGTSSGADAAGGGGVWKPPPAPAPSVLRPNRSSSSLASVASAASAPAAPPSPAPPPPPPPLAPPADTAAAAHSAASASGDASGVGAATVHGPAGRMLPPGDAPLSPSASSATPETSALRPAPSPTSGGGGDVSPRPAPALRSQRGVAPAPAPPGWAPTPARSASSSSATGSAGPETWAASASAAASPPPARPVSRPSADAPPSPAVSDPSELWQQWHGNGTGG